MQDDLFSRRLRTPHHHYHLVLNAVLIAPMDNHIICHHSSQFTAALHNLLHNNGLQQMFITTKLHLLHASQICIFTPQHHKFRHPLRNPHHTRMWVIKRSHRAISITPPNQFSTKVPQKSNTPPDQPKNASTYTSFAEHSAIYVPPHMSEMS